MKGSKIRRCVNYDIVRSLLGGRVVVVVVVALVVVVVVVVVVKDQIHVTLLLVFSLHLSKSRYVAKLCTENHMYKVMYAGVLLYGFRPGYGTDWLERESD